MNSFFTVGTNVNRKKIETPTDDIYTLIAQQNIFDIELYKYIEQLFQEQEEFIKDIPKDFRLVNAECSKCADETVDDKVSSPNLRNRKKLYHLSNKSLAPTTITTNHSIL